jgi:hypothetical protein
VIHIEFLEDLFHLPLSQQAYEEFQNLEIIYKMLSQGYKKGIMTKSMQAFSKSGFNL